MRCCFNYVCCVGYVCFGIPVAVAVPVAVHVRGVRVGKTPNRAPGLPPGFPGPRAAQPGAEGDGLGGSAFWNWGVYVHQRHNCGASGASEPIAKGWSIWVSVSNHFRTPSPVYKTPLPPAISFRNKTVKSGPVSHKHTTT